MTTIFWMLIGLLILAALLIVLPPIWRPREIAAADQDQRNIAIARQRLAELQEQLRAGALTQAQYEEQRTELEVALSDDLDIPGQAKASGIKGRWMVFVLVLLVPLTALSLYAGLGSYASLNQSSDNSAMPGTEDINRMVAGLAARMKSNPNDAQGWLMLGRSYKYLQQYPEAADAFAQAYRLLGDQAEVLLSYADALAMANDGRLSGKPAELVFKALALEPNNMTGLWLGGMAKAEAGDAAGAVQLWRKLEASLPPDSEARQEIQTLMANVENRMPEEQPTEAAPQGIDVEVSLAPELKSKISPENTVFIYAQALSGPKMPLAIVRKQVSDLPLTVNLNDSMAMMPEMKLSRFDQVKLIARISKSGNATQQPGDLIGVIDSVAQADHTRNIIVIDSEVK
ncbi:c-type cytochrome biogenesis protein CcmI [Methylobacter sp. YRD-M1]|uniref:c-type cytochrome biogenesis protein CcmI n=1 Tax=Methylobacter sp. YRD-M1 TaxID=2911520 RepID=UPI00227D2D7C|nr:c-type cytochrome biogenesis protein CcmI [Methylobacter sp. YRD-M1]WAK03392.1 c-type cytochrome biogenesis protein CcmI [Methylobacter sp. YRD-M1]